MTELFTVNAFTSSCTYVYIKKLDNGTLAASGYSVVAINRSITCVTCIWRLIVSFTFSNTRWKTYILVFNFWNLIWRNTLPVVQKRLCFFMNHYMDTLPARKVARWNRSRRKGLLKNVFLYCIRITNTYWIVIRTSCSAMMTTGNTWSSLVNLTYTCSWDSNITV